MSCSDRLGIGDLRVLCGLGPWRVPYTRYAQLATILTPCYLITVLFTEQVLIQLSFVLKQEGGGKYFHSRMTMSIPQKCRGTFLHEATSKKKNSTATWRFLLLYTQTNIVKYNKLLCQRKTAQVY